MGLAVTIIFFIIAVAALAIGGGFGTDGLRRIDDLRNANPALNMNESLNSARNRMQTGTIITWVTVGVAVLAFILLLIFWKKLAGGGGIAWILYILIFLVAIAAFIAGIFYAIAAQEIGNANLPDDNGARTQSIIAASMLIGGGVLMIIIGIAAIVQSRKGKTKEQIDQERREEEIRARNLKERQQLRLKKYKAEQSIKKAQAEEAITKEQIKAAQKKLAREQELARVEAASNAAEARLAQLAEVEPGESIPVPTPAALPPSPII